MRRRCWWTREKEQTAAVVDVVFEVGYGWTTVVSLVTWGRRRTGRLISHVVNRWMLLQYKHMTGMPIVLIAFVFPPCPTTILITRVLSPPFVLPQQASARNPDHSQEWSSRSSRSSSGEYLKLARQRTWTYPKRDKITEVHPSISLLNIILHLSFMNNLLIMNEWVTGNSVLPASDISFFFHGKVSSSAIHSSGLPSP